MRLLPPRFAIRAAFILALPALIAGCKPPQQGELKVTVVGTTPKLVDPSVRPPSPSDSVLLANVAQGLVRFDASGQIVPGLAERWNVTDDGLSYIFRLTPGEWPDGRKITGQQVARLLRRSLASASKNPVKDSLGAVAEIVAMTDRVIEIRLKAPRPNLLQLLAQPELAVIREGMGTGPFQLRRDERSASAGLLLERTVTERDDESESREALRLSAAPVEAAVRAFVAGETDLVLGGTFADLPVARAAGLPRGALRFDPVGGLFGLVPVRKDGPLADPEVRQLLVQAIDRDALVAALGVPGLVGRATVLEPGLEGLPPPVAPPWTATAIGERRPELIAEADRIFGAEERPVLRVAAPPGPGTELLLNRLAEDWAVLGIKVERARNKRSADLELVDLVAPSTSPAWFLRQFRCEAKPLCDAEVDEMLEAARMAAIPAQRSALLAQAAQRIDELQLFVPIAAPVRWSLVSDRIEGFAGNRFGHHSLVALEQKLARQGSE